MVDLNGMVKEIKEFLNSSIIRFHEEIGTPKSIGIYCCPMSGWISTHFNVTKNILEAENNCPDFEFVEFETMELKGWEIEYESEQPEYKLKSLVKLKDHEFSDEFLNELIFDYLKPIVTELRNNYASEFLLQMLDSNSVEVI